MTTLNKDGTPRKKRITKQMIMAKNRKNGQKKAWATRKERYPETNGFKPQMVDADLEKSMNQGLKVSAPVSTVKAEPVESSLTPDVLEKLIQLEDFLNDIPGNNFNRDQFIANAIINAINSALAIQGVTLVTKD
tara:strand:- start:982 stop:1383 length:402 start_codon:yes stop_codon:yes gene_type:complete